MKNPTLYDDDDKPTSAKPITIEGVTFRCYRTDALRYRWRSEDGQLTVGRNYNSDTYYAAIGSNSIAGANKYRAKRFRSQEAAMREAVLRAIAIA